MRLEQHPSTPQPPLKNRPGVNFALANVNRAKPCFFCPPPSEWNSDLRLCAELLSIFAALIIRRKLMLNPAFSGDLGGRRRLNTAIAAMIRRSTEKEKGKRFGRCRGFGLRRFADPLLQFGERHLAAVQWQDLIDHQLQPFDIVVQIHTGWIGLCRRRGVGRRRGIDVDFDQ